MAPSKSLAARVHAVKEFVTSRRGISVFKGALAYTLVITIPLIAPFDRLLHVPLTFSSMVIIGIAAFPGKSVGECVETVFLALTGVAIGAANFAILAKLRHALVAQAIVFGVMVYVLALVKAYSLKFFALALLAILMSFNGVYTSILTGGFSPEYLESYFEAYLWGGAIVLGVNILVFPISSEKQLRQSLVLSLDHIAVFTHLIAKTYTNTITEEERGVRDKLNQTIRADFGLLNQKVGAAAFEINWSRWSLQDYHALINKTRTMQLNLIAVYSSLAAYTAERKDDTGTSIFVEHFLPSTIGPFNQLRRDMHRTISEIQRELGYKSSLVQDRSGYEGYFDLERQEGTAVPEPSGSTAHNDDAAEDDLETDSQPKGEKSSEQPVPQRPTMDHRDTSHRSLQEQFRLVSARLEAEAERHAPASSYPSTPSAVTPGIVASSTVSLNASPTQGTMTPSGALLNVGHPEQPRKTPRGCARRLRTHFEDFERVQRDLLTDLILSGSLHGGEDDLYVGKPRSSVWDTYGPDIPSGYIESERGGESMLPDGPLRQRKSPQDGNEKGPQDNRRDSMRSLPTPVASDSIAISSNHSLMRVFSMLFAFEQFTATLEETHTLVMRKDDQGRLRRPRLRFHLYESLGRRHWHVDPRAPVTSTTPSTPATPSRDAAYHASNNVNAAIIDGSYSRDISSDESDDPSTALSMKEALALLDGKKYTPTQPNIWLRLSKIEAAFRSPISIYAFKCAAAALVFGSLIWAEGSRSFFLSYNLAGSLLTVIVALSPTLGQSLRSFVFQIGGSSLGYVFGMIVLEIFKNVGGYHFNPYGIACMIALYSVPMSYMLYEIPQWFTGVLLAMNGCGVLVLGEYINLVISHRTIYGEPPIRVGKALAGLAIAIAIVLAFQVLVLRNPARRTLRKALAGLMYSNMSYNTILQALVRGAMPPDAKFRPPQAAIDRVAAELIHREHKIQGQILSIMPLVAFSKDEPQFLKPFQAGAILKIIRANQIILDRMSESRAAIGAQPFSDHLLKHLVFKLSPYRVRGAKSIKNHFCLTSSSLMSKTPLPHDTGLDNWLGNVTHDALVVSRQFASTPEGMESIRNGEFTRYWFYLLTITSIGEQLQNVEDACRSLFGEVEDDPRLS